MNFVFRKAEKAIHFLRLISVDIVLGVIGGLYFASVIFDSRPSVYYYITFSLAVWVIYNLDHIFDGVRTQNSNESGIYQFHYKNIKNLLLIGIFASLISVFLFLFFLEKELIKFSVITFILVVLYLLMNFFYRNKSVFFPKELLIAILYTWGIFGGVFILKGTINKIQILLVFNYFLIVLANVSLFSRADYFENAKYNTIVTWFGENIIGIFIAFILVLAIVVSFVSGFVFSTWTETFILVLMNLSLFLFVLFPSMLKSNFFGVVADSVFMYPLIIYWIY